jgi:16S rRNA (adenine1518-N6/adenine1519-N6)-dimethyltransferase
MTGRGEGSRGHGPAHRQRPGGTQRPGAGGRRGPRPGRLQRPPPAEPQETSNVSGGEPARQTTAYLKRLFAQVGFVIDARKGQNFLVDLNLLDLLVRSAGIGPDDVVLEVGAGTGALTERLARVAGRVVSVEIDPRLAQLASDRLVAVDAALADRVTFVHGDALASKHRLSPAVLAAIDAARAASPGGRFRLVANLPYCVATPVISNLLALQSPFDTATVTVQREMAERMIAAAGSHAYNGLSVWVGSQCRGELVRILPPAVFWPRPQVDSAIVHLELDRERRAAIEDLGRFHDFVRDVFCHRRKLLRGVLVRMAGGKQQEGSAAAVARVFAALGLGPAVRAEEIEPDAFVRLEQAFAGRHTLPDHA